MNIHEYARLSPKEKEELIKNYALFIENYNDKENNISVYYLNGFFIEVTMKDRKMIDIIPYKRGYSTIKNNIQPIQKKKSIYILAA